MSFTREFFEELAGLADSKKIRKNRGFTSGSLWAGEKEFEALSEGTRKFFRAHQSEGELMLFSGGRGEIIDSGKAQFKVLDSAIFEFYHYRKTTSVFVRVYRLESNQDGRRWTALYSDENPLTPWWSASERED